MSSHDVMVLGGGKIIVNYCRHSFLLNESVYLVLALIISQLVLLK
jgi:hypothetical protein